MSKDDSGTSSSVECQAAGETANGTSGPVCPICKGVGFVHPAGPSGAPDYSRVIPCRCRQGELARQKQGLLQRYSNLDYLAHYTFDSFSPHGRGGSTPEYSRAYEVARRFAESPNGWLVLVGPVGCGKTHLSCAIANALLSNGRPVFYVGAADLLDDDGNLPVVQHTLQIISQDARRQLHVARLVSMGDHHVGQLKLHTGLGPQQFRVVQKDLGHARPDGAATDKSDFNVPARHITKTQVFNWYKFVLNSEL